MISRTLMNILFLILVALGSVACSAEQPTVSSRGVGGLELGMSASEVQQIFRGAVRKTTVMREGLEPALEVTFSNGSRAVAEIDDSDKVWAIRVLDPEIRTDRGARVGDSLAAVMDMYEDAELESGAEEGGFLSIVSEQLGGYFSFDTTGVHLDGKLTIEEVANQKLVLIVIM